MTEVYVPYEILKTIIATNPDYWLRTIRRHDDPMKESTAKRLPCDILQVNKDPAGEWDDWICEHLCDINPCYPRGLRMGAKK